MDNCMGISQRFSHGAAGPRRCITVLPWSWEIGGNLVSFDGQRMGTHGGLAEVSCDSLNIHITAWVGLDNNEKRYSDGTVTVT